MKYSWFDISAERKEEWEELCPANEYRVVDPDDLPNIIPVALREKAHRVFVMASGDSNGTVYYMVNILRVDNKDAAIDQEPFGLAFIGDNPIPSGCLIHHGNWVNRTSKPPQEFFDRIRASGIKSVYPLREIPQTDSGHIRDLCIKSQEEAFCTVVLKLEHWTMRDDG